MAVPTVVPLGTPEEVSGAVRYVAAAAVPPKAPAGPAVGPKGPDHVRVAAPDTLVSPAIAARAT